MKAVIIGFVVVILAWLIFPYLTIVLIPVLLALLICIALVKQKLIRYQQARIAFIVITLAYIGFIAFMSRKTKVDLSSVKSNFIIICIDQENCSKKRSTIEVPPDGIVTTDRCFDDLLHSMKFVKTPNPDLNTYLAGYQTNVGRVYFIAGCVNSNDASAVRFSDSIMQIKYQDCTKVTEWD